MSIKVMTNVRDHAPVGGNTLFVLMAFADFANEEGVCWPSMDRIAGYVRISKRQARRIVSELEAKGCITVHRHQGRSKTNIYTIRRFTEEDYLNPVDARLEEASQLVRKPVIMSAFPDELEDTDDLYPDEKGDMDDPFDNLEKGTNPTQKGTNCPRKEDIAMSPKPSMNHQEPSESNTLAVRNQKPKRKPKPPIDLGPFQNFYDLYPRHVAKGAAERAWKKLAPNETLSQQIMEALRSQLADGAFSDNPKYIPHPATWLNARRWEDEQEMPAPMPTANGSGDRKWYEAFLNGDDDDDDVIDVGGSHDP